MREVLPYQDGAAPVPVQDPSGYTPAPNPHGPVRLWPETMHPFEDDADLDLRQYWRIFRKHAQLIGACIVGATLLAGLVVSMKTPMYTATSIVMIESRTPQILDVKELMSEPLESNENDYYKTQHDILTSRSLAAQVIRDLDLGDSSYFNAKLLRNGLLGTLRDEVERSLPGIFSKPASEQAEDDPSEGLGADPAVIDAYLRNLSVEPRLGTHLVTVAFSTPDKLLAARIVNAHVKAYIRRGLDLHVQASNAIEDFLQKKLVELKERVEKSEAALNAYRRDRGIVTFSLNDTSGVIMHRLNDLSTALTKSETDRIALAAKDQLIQKGDLDSLPEVINSQLIQKLKEEISLLEGEYAAMSNRFNPGYHPLDDLGAKLNDSQDRLRSEIRSVVQSVELDYRAALTKEKDLNKEIERVKTTAMALHDASLQDGVLAREVDTNRQLYKSVLERVKEIGVSADIPTSNVSVVDKAEIPRRPSSPRIVLSIGISAFLGLCLGVGIAFLLEYLDDRFKDAEEVERYLRLPSLGTVPDFVRLKATSQSYGRSLPEPTKPGLNAPLGDSPSGEGKDKEIVVTTNRFSAAGEVYRAIRTAVLFSRAGRPPKSILITSATSAEGKTVTAINIALAFAQTRRRTLLVDTDLRRSRCHEVLDLDNYLGLTQVLVGQRPVEEVIHETTINSGLSFLSAGPLAPNPGELLASSEMRLLLENLCARYDHVILDSAPVMPVSDSVALATMVDGVLVIVGAQTPRELVRSASSRLIYVGAKVLGVVLNGIDMNSPGHYHYYNHYYSYEHKSGHSKTDPNGDLSESSHPQL